MKLHVVDRPDGPVSEIGVLRHAVGAIVDPDGRDVAIARAAMGLQRYLDERDAIAASEVS